MEVSLPIHQVVQGYPGSKSLYQPLPHHLAPTSLAIYSLLVVSCQKLIPNNIQTQMISLQLV